MTDNGMLAGNGSRRTAQEASMIEGMKAHRRMAMYVALGLSAGSTALLHGGTAYAAETHDYTETATSISGLEGTDKTGYMSDNRIVLGTEGGPTDRPFSTSGIFSGGGKENATADVSNNTITIHGLHASNGGGYSMVYGGISGTGAVTGNKVIFNHGETADALVGGYTGATDKDVRGNSVMVADGTIKDDIIGGWADSASSTGTLEGNTVTITGGTLGSHSDGIVYGARTSGDGVLTNNHVSFANATSRKALYGAATDDTNSAAALRGNSVTVTSGTINSSVEGGRSVGTGDVTGNAVSISGGSALSLIGGYASHTGNATGNVVTVTGGTVTGGITGGYVAGTGRTTGNTVNLGDGAHTDLAGAVLSGSDVSGGSKADDITDNTLNVAAKNIHVKSLNNFDTYNFKLNNAFANGDTMLSVTDAGAFSSGAGVDWTKINADLSGISADYINNIHGVHRVTLLKSAGTDDLYFDNYAARNYAATDTHESGLVTDTDEATAQSVEWVVNRFKDGRVTYDGTTATGYESIYGGVSYEGHTTTGNQLTVTGVYSTDEPKYAYGGSNEGATGDVTRNTVTIDLAHAADLVEEVYGGIASAEDNTGAVDHNTAAMRAGTTRLLYGGYTFGKGAVTNNEVHFDGGTSTGYVMGGYLDNTASTAEMTGNKVVFTNGTAAEIVGADSKGEGKLSGNTATFGSAGSVAEILRGALAENQAAVEGNAGTITSVAPTGLNAAYGGEAKSASNVRNNHVIVEGTGSGTIANVFGGATGKADGTYETILRTDGDASDTAAVLLDVNRYKGGHVTTDQDADSDLYGGYSASDHTDAGQTIGHTTSGNTLSVTRIASGKNINAYGGYTGGTAGGAENNKLTVNVTAAGAGTINNAYGGYTKGAGAVKGNQLTFSQGATLGDLIGGYADSAAHAAEVTGNTVTVTGGSVGGVVYGAKSRGTGRVSGNGVLVDSAAATADTLTGGYGASAERNRVELKDGTAHTVYGGDATTGDAVWNNVTITGGTVTDNIYGGQSLSGAANDNTVDIGAVHIQNGAANKAVVGGYASAVTDHNTIHLRGTEIDGIVLGGAIPDPASPLGMKANPNGKGNTLAIHAAGTKIADFAGVQNLRFYVPEERTAADTTPMLTLTANADKDIRGLSIGVGIAGEHSVLAKGDTISLLKIAAGNTLTADADLRNDVTGMQGVSMRYRFGLEKQGNDELVATVRDTELNPQTKSLVETRVAAAALINGGADLLSEGGMNAAVSAENTADQGMGAQDAANDHTYHLWAAQSGSALRLNSGSHIDAKGWNLNLGFARQKTAERSTLTYGPFVEYGHGSYDSYLDDGTHGDGAASYIGAGIMAKSVTENGSYVEGSVRIGRTKSDYTGRIAGQSAGYDMSSTYYGAHIGVGQKKELTGGTLETYAKYFYAHQSGGSERLTTGDLYDFDAVDSHRLRIGTRWTKENGAGEFYTGLSYEYEFGSDARASYAGYGTPTPTLKGSTGIFELGYRFARPGSNVSYGVNLTGMMGKRRGITGSMQVNWAL